MHTLDYGRKTTRGSSDPGDGSAQRDDWSRYLRRPVDSDAVAMRRLVAATGMLDLNSTYAYLLMATDFDATTIVAERDGQLCGLITGYHPPARPDVLFVWQVAVDPSAQGTGLAGTMLDALVRRVRIERHGHPVTVEATVSPDNSASRALFGAFARRHGVPLTEHPRFTADLMSDDQDDADEHDDEPILCIGPIAEQLTR